ncbi:hypothetical protein ELY15_09260 [Legionella sp. km772]|nr:hypothetical protein ELY15_09260 [Legionella sp. km772]
MKKIIGLLIASGFSLMMAGAFADGATSMDTNWSCTTNASSSSVAEEKSADDQMSNSTKSAADAFAFAAKHCRDCTKITCESKSE